MSRHVIGVDVGGNSSRSFSAIAAGVSHLIQQVDKLNESLHQMDKSMEDAAGSQKSEMFAHMADMLGEFSSKVNEYVEKVATASAEFIKGIVHTSAEFEDSQSEMRFAFGQDWQNVYAQVKSDAARLTFTFKETVGLATSLGRMKINPFGGTDKEHTEFLAKTGKMVRALDVLQDTADATGKGVQDVVVSIRNAMAGQWLSLEDRFDIPKEKIKEWRKEIDKLKEPQEKYNALVKNLASMFGGAGAEKAANFNKAIVQIPDILEQIKGDIGMASLKILTGSVREFIDALNSFHENKAVMSALSEGFKVIAQALAQVIRFGAQLVKWLEGLISAAPWLPKLAAYIGMASVALAVLVGTVLSAVVGLAAFAAGVAMIGAEALVAGAILGIVLIPAFVMLAGLAGIFILMLKGGAEAISNNWGGVGSVFEKLKLIFQGLTELVESYNGVTGKMSVETAAKLKKAGVFEFVTDVFKVFHRLHAFWEEFTATLSEVGTALAPTFIPMVNEFIDLIKELADALGITKAGIDASKSGTETWADKGRALAEIMIELAKGMITVIRWGVMFARIAIHIAQTEEFADMLKITLIGVAFAAMPIIGPFILLGALLYGAYKLAVLLKNEFMALANMAGFGAAMGSLSKGSKGGKVGYGEIDVDFWSSLVKPALSMGDKVDTAKRKEMAGKLGYDAEGNFTGVGNSPDATKRMRRGQEMLPGTTPGAVPLEESDTFKRAMMDPDKRPLASSGGQAQGPPVADTKSHALLAQAVSHLATIAAKDPTLTVDGKVIATAANNTTGADGGH